MHLFEAALAWIEGRRRPAGAPWRTRSPPSPARSFLDADGGFLREFFDAYLQPAPGAEGRRVDLATSSNGPGFWRSIVARRQGRRERAIPGSMTSASPAMTRPVASSLSTISSLRWRRPRTLAADRVPARGARHATRR